MNFNEEPCGGHHLGPPATFEVVPHQTHSHLTPRMPKSPRPFFPAGLLNSGQLRWHKVLICSLNRSQAWQRLWHQRCFGAPEKAGLCCLNKVHEQMWTYAPVNMCAYMYTYKNQSTDIYIYILTYRYLYIIATQRSIVLAYVKRVSNRKAPRFFFFFFFFFYACFGSFLNAGKFSFLNALLFNWV